MKIRRHDERDVTVLRLSGNFSGGPDSERFAHAIENLIEDKRWNVVLEFREVNWINSPGIGILVRNYSHFVRFGGQMVVAELNTRIAILFDMMIRNIFEVYQTETEAIESFENHEQAPPARVPAALDV